MILEIINPSDKITLESDDAMAAGIAILLISKGMYGLVAEDGSTIFPILAFGGLDEFIKEKQITSIDDFIDKNKDAMIAALDSVLYGGISDRKLFDLATNVMSIEDKREFRVKWNEEKRSSMNNIGEVCLKYAEKLRKLAKKDQEKQSAIIK